jgi:neopullulanase
MLSGLLAALLFAAPQVDKIEPPSWWRGHSLNPVRLLVRGRDLRGARVTATGAGLRVAGPARVSAAGTSLFVDVEIHPQAAPGRRDLQVTTSDGQAAVPFEVLAPLPRPGRFQGFSPDDVMYLVMPDRFANGDPSNDDPARARGLLDRGKGRYYHGGDLRGILERLPYLKELGVTALWMTPVYDNVDHLNERETYDGQPITDYHGYGAVDFYAVDEHLGTVAQYREVVDAAHALGIKVVQDQVANHTGPYHPWVKDPPTPTWYNGSAERHLANTWQTWTLADPHATPELRRATVEGWFIDILPDLNQDDPETARYLVQNALWWVGITGLDAIRQDTLPYVPRTFWAQWSAALEKEYPQVTRLGELFDGDPALVSYFQGGRVRDGLDTGIDSLFDFPLYYPVRRAFAEGKPIRELAMMLARDHLYADASVLLTHAGLHDTSRFMQEPGATTEGLRLAHTFLLTTRGTPLLYYGDEIGLPGGNDPDNRRDFPGGFPGDARSAFEASGRTPAESAVFDHLKRLAALRRDLPALRRGRLVQLALGDQQYAYGRVIEGGEAVAVVLNNATGPAAVEFGAGPLGWGEGMELVDRLGGSPVRVQNGRVRVALPDRRGVILAPR